MGASSGSTSGSSSSSSGYMFTSKKPSLRNGPKRSAMPLSSGRRLHDDYSTTGVSAGFSPNQPTPDNLSFMRSPTYVSVPIQAPPLVPRPLMASQLQSLQCRFAVCKPHNAQQQWNSP
jgi:hypothetical protein